jgi:hypothetical protein
LVFHARTMARAEMASNAPQVTQLLLTQRTMFGRSLGPTLGLGLTSHFTRENAKRSSIFTGRFLTLRK